MVPARTEVGGKSVDLPEPDKARHTQISRELEIFVESPTQFHLMPLFLCCSQMEFCLVLQKSMLFPFSTVTMGSYYRKLHRKQPGLFFSVIEYYSIL